LTTTPRKATAWSCSGLVWTCGVARNEVSDLVVWYPPVVIPRRTDCPGKCWARRVDTPNTTSYAVDRPTFSRSCVERVSLTSLTKLSSHPAFNPDPRSRLRPNWSAARKAPSSLSLQVYPFADPCQREKTGAKRKIHFGPSDRARRPQGETKRFNDVLASRLSHVVSTDSRCVAVALRVLRLIALSRPVSDVGCNKLFPANPIVHLTRGVLPKIPSPASSIPSAS
jgi:hypothetical protein